LAENLRKDAQHKDEVTALNEAAATEKKNIL
jgi:hypothetical protein